MNIRVSLKFFETWFPHMKKMAVLISQMGISYMLYNGKCPIQMLTYLLMSFMKTKYTTKYQIIAIVKEKYVSIFL